MYMYTCITVVCSCLLCCFCYACTHTHTYIYVCFSLLSLSHKCYRVSLQSPLHCICKRDIEETERYRESQHTHTHYMFMYLYVHVHLFLKTLPMMDVLNKQGGAGHIDRNGTDCPHEFWPTQTSTPTPFICQMNINLR